MDPLICETSTTFAAPSLTPESSSTAGLRPTPDLWTALASLSGPTPLLAVAALGFSLALNTPSASGAEQQAPTSIGTIDRNTPIAHWMVS